MKLIHSRYTNTGREYALRTCNECAAAILASDPLKDFERIEDVADSDDPDDRCEECGLQEDAS